MKYNISVKNQNFEIEVGEIKGGTARVTVNEIDFDVRIGNYSDIKRPGETISALPGPDAAAQSAISRPMAPSSMPEPVASGNIIKAPIPGLIIDVGVKVGDPVKVGQTVIVMEAMKMENSIAATASGTVKEILVQKGNQVMTGAVLVIIKS